MKVTDEQDKLLELFDLSDPQCLSDISLEAAGGARISTGEMAKLYAQVAEATQALSVLIRNATIVGENVSKMKMSQQVLQRRDTDDG